jgi:hypothetical protein
MINTKFVKDHLFNNIFLRNFYQMRFSGLDLIYKLEDLNIKYYKQAKKSGDVELEHQIGRLTNFKKIVEYIDIKKIQGDMIEFGSWKGFSLLWTSYLLERRGIFNKKIVGIDCFEGLPSAEGPFTKGGFKNTSLKECRQNIFRSSDLYDATKNNIHIEKFLFSEKTKILRKLGSLKINKFCFIHIDSDLSKSFTQVMNILTSGNIMANHCFILVDDYGTNKKLQTVVNEEMNKLKKGWKVSVHSNTLLTKNFELIRK